MLKRSEDDEEDEHVPTIRFLLIWGTYVPSFFKVRFKKLLFEHESIIDRTDIRSLFLLMQKMSALTICLNNVIVYYHFTSK